MLVLPSYRYQLTGFYMRVTLVFNVLNQCHQEILFDHSFHTMLKKETKKIEKDLL